VKWFLYDGKHCYSSGHEPLWMINQAVKKHKASEQSQALHDRLGVTISRRLDTASEFARHFRIGDRPSPVALPDSLGTGGLFMETGLVPRLRKAQDLALEPQPEPVGGVPCPVLKASFTVTNDARGQKHAAEHVYRLHVDPAHDYQIARMEVTVTSRDLTGGRKISGPYLLEKRTVNSIRFQQIGEAWVPMEWQRSYSAHRLDQPELYQWETNKVRRTRVLLNPDHDAAGSFKPTLIQDGWTIRLRGFDQSLDHAGPLAWKRGQVVDKAGQRVVLP
jgi:hypothetical protein